MARIRQPRLTAASLAGLLAHAEDSPYFGVVMLLASESARGEVLLTQLRHLRAQVGRDRPWRELERVMLQVEEIALRGRRLSHPVLMIEGKAAPLEHLAAAARIRSQEKGAWGRPRFEEVADWLDRLVSKQKR